MSLLEGLLGLVGQPPGSLAYYVIVLFALEAMAGMAWEEWCRMRRHEYRRMTWGFVALLVLHGVRMALETLRWRGVLSPAMAWLWPPLDDFLLTCSLALLVWAFVPLLISPMTSRRVPPIWVAVLVFAVVLFVVTVFVWRPIAAQQALAADYQGHWLTYAWIGLRLLLLIVATFFVLARDSDYRIWLGAAFSILMLAQIAQALQGRFALVGHQVGWMRVAELAAFPLLALTLYQSIASDLYAYGQEFKTVSEESLRQTRELLFMLETSKATTSSLDLDTVLDGIVENVVLALNADQCAIAFLSPEGPDKLQIMATYDPLHGDRRSLMGSRQPGQSLSAEDYPTINHALEQKHQVVSNNVEDNPAVQGIFRLLGTDETGPLIVQPLVSNANVLGALLLGNARSKRPFSQGDSNLCRALATQVATAMENARLYQDVEMQARQLQEMLRVREVEGNQGRMIIEGISDGVLVSDEENGIILANEIATKILSKSREELLDQDISLLYAEASLAIGDKLRREPIETLITVGDKVLNVCLSPLKDSDDSFKGIVAIFRDVTGKTHTEIARADFISTASHELLPYLNSMQGHADLLLEEAVGPLTPTQRKFLEKARYNAGRMDELVDDLIDVSELGLASPDLRLESTSLPEIIAASMVAVQDLIEQKKLTVNLTMAQELPPVMADPGRLRQVLENLLDNACKYTPEEGDISIAAELKGEGQGGLPGGDQVVVSIQDSGVGMTTEEQERVFDLFYRADNPLSLEAGGAGIGLAISKSIVEAYGGSIWVESEPGAGSVFRFTLPAAGLAGPMAEPAKKDES